MLVLDLVVGILILGLFYLMLPKYSKIGKAIDHKIEIIKEQNSEIIPDEFTQEQHDNEKNTDENQKEN